MRRRIRLRSQPHHPQPRAPRPGSWSRRHGRRFSRDEDAASRTRQARRHSQSPGIGQLARRAAPARSLTGGACAPGRQTQSSSALKNVPSRIGRVSDDAYKGDAQYEVLVDGTQIGGIQTAHASHAVGQSDHLLVQGNWGSGTHDAAVVFLNDAYDGTPTTDRNLYVDGACYDGVSVDGGHKAL